MKNFTKFIAVALAAAAITISAGTTSVSADSTQTSYDSQFLNDMGLCADRWDDTYTYFHWGEVSKAVDECWAKATRETAQSKETLNKYVFPAEGGEDIYRLYGVSSRYSVFSG